MKNLKAYDKAGNEITSEYDSSTGKAKFSATPSRITYDYDTDFEDVQNRVVKNCPVPYFLHSQLSSHRKTYIKFLSE